MLFDSSPITNFEIQGFKSIKNNVKINLKPLTILAGRNSSGKSSIVQPLLLLKQSLEAQQEPDPLLLDGPCTKFHEARQMLWRGKNKEDHLDQWTLKLSTSKKSISQTFGFEKNKKFKLLESSWEYDKQKATLNKSLSEEETLKIASMFENLYQGYNPSVRQSRSGFYISIRDKEINHEFFKINPSFNESLLKLIHIPGLRGNPERSYSVARVGNQFPGAFQDYTASVLFDWKENSKQEKTKQIGEDLKALGLTWKVEPFKINDTRVELKVGRLPTSQQGGAQDLVNITDVGFGVSQVMPVIVALNVAERNQLVHIEQPEIHLHPNAQVKMAQILLRAAQRGVQLIVETHSSTLIKAIQLEIAKSRNLESLVQLHWCVRDHEGVTRVESAVPDKLGAYGEWPLDFNDIELDLDAGYIDATYQKQHEKA